MPLAGNALAGKCYQKFYNDACLCSERTGKLHRYQNVSRSKHTAVWAMCLTGLQSVP